jgi:hypothetical protein
VEQLVIRMESAWLVVANANSSNDTITAAIAVLILRRKKEKRGKNANSFSKQIEFATISYHEDI